jgi:hypothetical protein
MRGQTLKGIAGTGLLNRLELFCHFMVNVVVSSPYGCRTSSENGLWMSKTQSSTLNGHQRLSQTQYPRTCLDLVFVFLFVLIVAQFVSARWDAYLDDCRESRRFGEGSFTVHVRDDWSWHPLQDDEPHFRLLFVDSNHLFQGQLTRSNTLHWLYVRLLAHSFKPWFGDSVTIHFLTWSS